MSQIQQMRNYIAKIMPDHIDSLTGEPDWQTITDKTIKEFDQFPEANEDIMEMVSDVAIEQRYI